jgi:hypothetical protein
MRKARNAYSKLTVYLKAVSMFTGFVFFRIVFIGDLF